jgi:hypothetical protein
VKVLHRILLNLQNILNWQLIKIWLPVNWLSVVVTWLVEVSEVTQ